AASRALTAAERERLNARLIELRAAAADDYRRLDSRLHLTIAELSGSPSLVSLIAENRMAVNRLLDRIPLLAPNIAHSDEQHEHIVWAVLVGDADRAAAAMAEHLAGSQSLLRAFLS
ncbi:MAG: FCD domain-containing protein, partial [Yonghaparkia sp.]|nr:FCD domain-containing protein [Microcella sp.]